MFDAHGITMVWIAYLKSNAKLTRRRG
jgi:hypothetical protein